MHSARHATGLMVLILSRAELGAQAHEVEQRQAIRQTWGNEGLAPGLGVIRLFLLGVKEGDPGRRQQEMLERESAQHRDILQQNFTDSYLNLTVKTVMGLSWVAAHCPQARYVMKTDSDVLVNTQYLVHELLRPELQPRTNYTTGLVWRGIPPIRDKSHKYYMPREEYPGEVYPAYLSGLGYVFSGDLATELYRASLSIPFLRFEDVYVGACLESIGIEPTPAPGGLFAPWGLYYSSSRYSKVVAIHKFSPSELLDRWHRMQRDKLVPTLGLGMGTEVSVPARTVK